jgi:hypothetical protein
VKKPGAVGNFARRRLRTGGGDDQLDVRPLSFDAAAKLEPTDPAGKLRFGHHHLDLGMRIEQLRSRLGIVSVEGLKPRFAEDVGSDHSDKWLIFND